MLIEKVKKTKAHKNGESYNEGNPLNQRPPHKFGVLGI